MMPKFLLPFLLFLFIVYGALAQAPIISSVSPLASPAGMAVTINGTGFDPTALNNVVYFGGAKATITAATNTRITVIAPAGAYPVQYLL